MYVSAVFLLGTEVLFISFYFCFMYVLNVFILGTKAVFVSFYEQKSILTVVFLIKYTRYIEYELKRMRRMSYTLTIASKIKANSVFLKPVLQNA